MNIPCVVSRKISWQADDIASKILYIWKYVNTIIRLPLNEQEYRTEEMTVDFSVLSIYVCRCMYLIDGYRLNRLKLQQVDGLIMVWWRIGGADAVSHGAFQLMIQHRHSLICFEGTCEGIDPEKSKLSWTRIFLWIKDGSEISLILIHIDELILIN